MACDAKFLQLALCVYSWVGMEVEGIGWMEEEKEIEHSHKENSWLLNCIDAYITGVYVHSQSDRMLFMLLSVQADW